MDMRISRMDLVEAMGYVPEELRYPDGTLFATCDMFDTYEYGFYRKQLLDIFPYIGSVGEISHDWSDERPNVGDQYTLYGCTLEVLCFDVVNRNEEDVFRYTCKLISD